MRGSGPRDESSNLSGAISLFLFIKEKGLQSTPKRKPKKSLSSPKEKNNSREKETYSPLQKDTEKFKF